MMLLLLLAGFLALGSTSFPGEDVGGICDGREAAIHQQAVNRGSRPQPRNNKPTPELIRDNGYPAEEHWVTTPDGYILALHRIPHGISTGASASPRPPILVIHGLLCSSADWVISTPSKGLGYMLADAGYDVWLGNYRGNTYSRNHTFLNPDKNDGFWDFSWDEMGHYDLPAMIEKVLELTEESQLFYVGFSMGTTGFMAMHHYRPDIGEKIKLANLLAPVAGESAMGGPLGWIAGFMGGIFDHIIEDLLNMMGVGEFLPSNLFIDCLASLFCHDITAGLCSNILFILAGSDSPQMNNPLLDSIMHHTPAGASTHSLLHYAQLKATGGFHGFDWGSDKLNYQHHNGPVPTYNFGDVATPVALYWGDNDWFAMPEDILQTIIGLPNIVPGMNHEVEYEQWTHLDFLWAIDADKFVYSFLLDNLNTCKEQDCRNMNNRNKI